jgi:hypothetical protein
MHAVEVVGGAEAGEVFGRVIAAAGAEADVVDVNRHAAGGSGTEQAYRCRSPSGTPGEGAGSGPPRAELRLANRPTTCEGASRCARGTPDELIARLATLVPPPRTHALRYHGHFAPNAKHRGRVVPASAGTPSVCEHRPEKPVAPEAPGELRAAPSGFRLTPPEGPAARSTPGESRRPSPRYRVPWAELQRKVFAIDVITCPRCQGRLEVIAFIAEPTIARRILDHLGLASQAPPVARARSPDEPRTLAPARTTRPATPSTTSEQGRIRRPRHAKPVRCRARRPRRRSPCGASAQRARLIRVEGLLNQ